MESVGQKELHCGINGETDAADLLLVSEASLNVHDRRHCDCFRKCQCEPIFDYASLQPDQLAQILDVNPTRRLELKTGIFGAEQSRVLATRTYPLDLKLAASFAFHDSGTAFVDALEDRQLSFGPLGLFGDTDNMRLKGTNLEKLLQLHVFEKLEMGWPSDDCVLLPVCTNGNAFEYKVDAEQIRPADFDSLNIVTKNLFFTVFVNYYDNWEALLISFLNRVAALGHLERLCCSIYCRYGEDDSDDDEPLERDNVALIAAALVGTIHDNPKLLYLDLSDTLSSRHWGPYLQSVFEAIEEHEYLRTLVVQSYPLDGDFWDESDVDDDEELYCRFEFERSWLTQLLSRNRNITVVDKFGNKCKDGSTIDKAYAMNDFYNGSASLTQASMSLRSLLVEAALTESASKNVRYAALLLSQHLDTLCVFLHTVILDDAVSFAPIPRGTTRSRTSKRKKTMIQPSRVAKKAARDEPCF